jgi:hypothetical protein
LKIIQVRFVYRSMTDLEGRTEFRALVLVIPHLGVKRSPSENRAHAAFDQCGCSDIDRKVIGMLRNRLWPLARKEKYNIYWNSQRRRASLP